MATMVALQSSMASLSIFSNSFLGQRLSPPSASAPIKSVDQPFLVVNKINLTAPRRYRKFKECKPNGLPVLQKVHVKVGDTVQLITGYEKGKIGEIVCVFRHNSTVIVKGLNLKTKHLKDKTKSDPGQIVMREGPIHSSNVMLYSKEKEVRSRVGHKILEDGTRVRYLIKTGEIIDSAENWKVIKERNEKKLVASS